MIFTEPPTSEQIQSMPIYNMSDISADLYKKAGVYFLWKGSEMVYIGYSMNLATRLTAHQARNFDSYQYCLCDKGFVRSIERFLIRTIAPVGNGNVCANIDGIKTDTRIQMYFSEEDMRLIKQRAELAGHKNANRWALHVIREALK